MITAHEVSAARELIDIAEKWQQYFDMRLSTPFLKVDLLLKIKLF